VTVALSLGLHTTNSAGAKARRNWSISSGFHEKVQSTVETSGRRDMSRLERCNGEGLGGLGWSFGQCYVPRHRYIFWETPPGRVTPKTLTKTLTPQQGESGFRTLDVVIRICLPKCPRNQ
jgi:hypothetical protein